MTRSYLDSIRLWTSYDGAHQKPVEVLTLLRPQQFPRFVARPSEHPNARVQRWRREYKELSARQHRHVFASVCWAVYDAQGVPPLDRQLTEYGAIWTKDCDLSYFSFRAVEPKEVTVVYQLAGSARRHQLFVSPRRPTEQI